MYIYVDENIEIVKDSTGGLLLKDNIPYKVNPSGVEILLLCDGSKSIENIVSTIKNKYEIEDAYVLQGIEAFINEYINKGVLLESYDSKDVSIKVKGNDQLVIPPRLSLELTNQCQLKCAHCFNLSGNTRENELTISDFIDISNSFLKLGTKNIFITGGEVFIKKDVNKLIKFISQRFNIVTIATNAYSISKESIDLLSKYKNIQVQVSIDGNENTHDRIRGVKGAYRKTLENIKIMRSYNIPISIAFTMNDKNKEDLEDIIKLSKDLKCNGVNISLTSLTGRAADNNIGTNVRKEFNSILETQSKKYEDENFSVTMHMCESEITQIENSIEYLNKCGAGYNILHIFSDGQVSICPAARNFDLGNIRTDSIEDILNINNIKRAMNIPTPNKVLCGDCESYEICGKCIANMLEKSKEECKIINDFQKIYSEQCM